MKTNTPTRVENVFLTHGLTMGRAQKMSDAELLHLENFGRKCLNYVRGFVR